MAVVLNGRCFHSFAAWPVDIARLKTLSLSPNSQGINKLIKSAAHMGSPSRAAGMSGCYCQVCLMPRVRCFRGLVSLTVTFCPVRSGRARLKSRLGLALRLLRRLQVQSQAETHVCNLFIHRRGKQPFQLSPPDQDGLCSKCCVSIDPVWNQFSEGGILVF